MKKILSYICAITLFFPALPSMAADKVVVIPLSSTIKALINPKEIGNYHVVIGPSGSWQLQVPVGNYYVLTDLIGTNHLAVTIKVDDVMKLDLTTYQDIKLSMTSGISCPPGSTVTFSNVTGTVTAVTISGYYY